MQIYPPSFFLTPNRLNYRQLFFVQVVYIGIALLFNDLADLFLGENTKEITKTFFFVTGSIYILMLWNFIRLFLPEHSNKIKMFFILLNITFLASLYVANPIIRTEEGLTERIWLLCIHLILFSVELLAIYFTIKDLSKARFFNNDKLWGVAALFLMIGISFGSLYDLICIVRPGALGVDTEPGVLNYMECLYYSFTVIGGVDPAYADTLKIIKNLAVIEAVWNQLFLVIIVGRMLGKPTE